MVPRKYLLIVSICGMLVSLDQLTKFLVTLRLKPNESLPVIENFLRITYLQNSGMAFGLMSNVEPSTRTTLLLFFPILVMLVMSSLFTRLKEHHPLSIYAYCFIIGGGLGNLLDRVRSGFVVDFLDFHYQERWHFPAFNIADCSITFGLALLILHFIFEKEGRGE